MNIAEKLEFLKAPCELHLFKEGVFWVAYEQNAYFIWSMKGYKPNKKYIKSIQQEIVSVGFPERALQSQFIELQVENATEYLSENHILITLGNQIDQNEFQEWKNSIQNAVPTDAVSVHHKFLPNNQSISEQILQFDLSNATPIDCMIFINQLKSSLIPQNKPP
jgi:hypothetical protein